jgi:hypothetical protein
MDRPPPPDPRLDDRILGLLSERRGRIAFNGLRRALDAHPESLTRALRRLERSGAIGRDRGGYSVLGEDADDAPDGPPPRTVATVALPLGLSISELLGRLAGRRVGTLRWVGVFERGDASFLAWSKGAGAGFLLLTVRNGSLEVLSDDLRSDPTDDPAAYDLLRRALLEVRGVAPSERTDRLEFRRDDATPGAGWAS